MEVPTREELQVSLQVNIGLNYTKRGIVIGEYLQTKFWEIHDFSKHDSNYTKYCFFYLWFLETKHHSD